jgi:hypothetical protein
LSVVLSCVGRGLCDGLITRPEESYRVSVCDHRNPERVPMFQVGNGRKMNEFNPLRPNGNYMYLLLQQEVALHFYIWVSYDFHCKQLLFP